MTDDLATRLEAGPGSRELDAEIRFLFFDDMTRCNFEEGCYHGDCEAPGCGGWLGLHDERKSYPGRWQDDERLPRYTESVDDGLALLREMGHVWLDLDGPRKYLTIPSSSPNYWRAHLDDFGTFDVMGWGATPALALSAALVRVKEQETDV